MREGSSSPNTIRKRSTALSPADPLNPFPRATPEDWRRVVRGSEADAPGRGVRAAHVTARAAHASSGRIEIAPLYTAADAPSEAPPPGVPPFTRGPLPVAHVTPAPGVRDADSVSGTPAPGVRHGFLRTCALVSIGSQPRDQVLIDEIEGGADALWLDVEQSDATESIEWIASSEVMRRGVPIAIRGVNARSRTRLPNGEDPASPAFRAWIDLAATLLRSTAMAEPRLDVYAAVAENGCSEDELRSLEQRWREFATKHGSRGDGSRGASPDSCEASRRGLFGVSTVAYNEAGADAALELGIALATAVAYARLLDEAAPSKASSTPFPDARTNAGGARAIHDFAGCATFVVGVECDLFLDIAKLRALRQCWSFLQTSCGVSAQAARIHAVGSRRVLTERHAWNNILRATEQSWAAMLGGANWITAPWFDGVGGADARRLARNTPIILREESHLDAVLDPAGGSYALESLTERLAEAAWTELQAIESQGGLRSALLSGWLHRRVEESRTQRASQIRNRSRLITGISAYPVIDEETPTASRRRQTEDAEQARPRIAESVGRIPLAEAFRLHPDAAPFEELRDRADALASHDGRRPTVFLPDLGSEGHRDLVRFARDLFAVGGLLATEDHDSTGAGGGQRVDEVVARFRASQAHAACLCASDAEAGDALESLASALKAAGARAVLATRRPVPHDAGAPFAIGAETGSAAISPHATSQEKDADAARAQPEARGVDLYIHPGCDAVSVLSRLLDALERPAS